MSLGSRDESVRAAARLPKGERLRSLHASPAGGWDSGKVGRQAGSVKRGLACRNEVPSVTTRYLGTEVN